MRKGNIYYIEKIIQRPFSATICCFSFCKIILQLVENKWNKTKCLSNAIAIMKGLKFWLFRRLTGSKIRDATVYKNISLLNIMQRCSVGRREGRRDIYIISPLYQSSSQTFSSSQDSEVGLYMKKCLDGFSTLFRN